MKALPALLLSVLLVTSAPVLVVSAPAPAKPSPRDKCPICGMFVAKYPDFLAQVIFKDGSRYFFDGAKDMFHYLFDLPRYNPSKKTEEIDAVYVTDYYSLEPIDGAAAFLVIGSDVTGPMGRELIPFEKEDDAVQFKEDHSGNSILRFKEVTGELVKGLD